MSEESRKKESAKTPSSKGNKVVKSTRSISNNTCYRDTIVTDVTNDTNNKSNKSNKSNKVTYIYTKETEQFLKNQGTKEYILGYLYQNIDTYEGIDKKLKLPKGSAKTVINRNKELFEIDHKEKKNYYKLSLEGIKFVEFQLKKYEEGIKKAKEVAEQVTAFKEEKEKKELETADLIELLKEFIEKEAKPPSALSIIIDFKELSKFSTELADKLLDDPEEFIQMGKMVLENSDLYEDQHININFTEIPDKIKISEIGSEYLDKIISTECVIKIDRDIAPLCISAKFECPACGNVISILQGDELLKTPNRCSCGRRGNCRMISQEKIDKKELLIEEFLEETQQRFIKLEILKKSLTNFDFRKKLVPGTKVNVIGIVKEKKKFIRGKESVEGEFYMEANNIEFLEEIDIDFFDQKNIDQFNEMAQEVDANGPVKLVSSFAPYVYGLNDIKETILNQAVTPKSKNGRRTLNVLAIGDTAVGKTHLFMFAEKYIFRCLGASEDTSAAGLTIGLVKDEFFGTGGWIAEPGLLPKANNSIAIIDEIDKLDENVLKDLHSAMSRCYVKKTKIKDATLPADTCIIAGCNPFSTNPYKKHNDANWSERFKVPNSFINRFDLVFDIKDEIKEETDREISKQIHKKAEGIKLDPKNHYDPITLKKFLLYIKQQQEPTISKKIDEKLEDYYIQCRKKIEEEKDTPITARLKETLITLSKCYAKLRLSKKVEKKDIENSKRLIELMFKRNKESRFQKWPQ